ncbi:hypothetical protein F5884DRAFT_685283, partial [Xylogone sp. PMI_703]
QSDMRSQIISHRKVKTGCIQCKKRHIKSEQYLLFAAHHQSLALPLIRSALTSINEDNCHALFACGHIIAGYTFGSAKAPESLVFSSGLGVMSEFVPLLRGAFSVYDYALKWLSVGPLAFCLEKSLNESPEFSQNPDDACFARLLPLLYTNGDEDTYTCCEALNCLRRLLAMAATPNQTISARTLAYSWAAQVPPRYPVLICERKPEALVVMAYYCVMLRMIDSFWYMKGYAARLLDQCRRNLSDKWLRHIDWPLSIVGLPVDK